MNFRAHRPPPHPPLFWGLCWQAQADQFHMAPHEGQGWHDIRARAIAWLAWNSADLGRFRGFQAEDVFNKFGGTGGSGGWGRGEALRRGHWHRAPAPAWNQKEDEAGNGGGPPAEPMQFSPAGG